MRRLAGIVMVGLIFAACTPDTSEPPDDVVATAAPSTAEPTATPSPEITLEPTETCDGLGRPRPGGEVTFISEGRLIAVSPTGENRRCLAELADLSPIGADALRWNATGDRVLVSGRALSTELAATRKLAPSGEAAWSRPTGTSVVWLDDGKLVKRSSFGGRPADISFLARHDAVTYHPAGTHIATSGKGENGSYGLYIATNLGTEPQLIARGEAANFISNLQFSEDGRFLHYDARHGPRNWHLHRLSMGDDPVLETIDKGADPYEYVVSPIFPHELAWFEVGDCVAGEPGRFDNEFSKFQIPEEMRAKNIHPIGWVTPSKLVVRVATTGCSTAQPGDVYVLSQRAAPVLIAEENHGSVAVRMKMPPPPPPPGEEQEVIA